MPVLADEAAPNLIAILEVDGFVRLENNDDRVVLVNRNRTPHPIVVRLNSPLTDEIAEKKLRQAGCSQDRIDRFLERHISQDASSCK